MVFQRRANVIKSVPHFLKGPFRNAMLVVAPAALAQEMSWREDRQRQVEGEVRFVPVWQVRAVVGIKSRFRRGGLRPVHQETANTKRTSCQSGTVTRSVGRVDGRQALEGADWGRFSSRHSRNFAVIASETRQTTGPSARHVPVRRLADRFVANLRSSRKATAAGQSGMTNDNEHLRPLLEKARDMHLFFHSLA